MDYLEFNTLINKSIYNIEKNSYGHVILILTELFPKKLNKNQQELLILHIINIVKKSLDISKKYGKNKNYTHLYLDDCGVKNFDKMFFKDINKRLSEELPETLENLYIYTNSKILFLIWPILKKFLDPITQDKIKIIRR
jgi:hypothetical protein